MMEFSKLCKTVEDLDPAVYEQVLTEKSKKIIAALTVIGQSNTDAAVMYVNILLAAVAADGKLDENEYGLMKPFFEMIAGRELTYEEAVALFKERGLDKPKEFMDSVDSIVDKLGIISDQLRRTSSSSACWYVPSTASSDPRRRSGSSSW